MGHIQPVIKLSQIILLSTWICLAYTTTVQDGDFHTSESKYRPYKTSSSNKVPSVIYGKGKYGKSVYVVPSPKPKAVAKFKPSQEDSGYDTEYKTITSDDYSKYAHQYANQAFNAQKYAAHLSDAQKVVVAQAYNPTKYKFIPIATKAPEIATEKYQTLHLQQHVIVQPTKVPKKAYALDTTHQSTDYKTLYNFDATQESDNKGWSAYEPYQSYGKYGVVAPEKASELSTITGFKIPISVASHNSDTKEISTDHHEEEHYPHHEPKYEYMYQVHDHEKHNTFGHAESRKGKTTFGKYYVQLPDGRLETVKYYVDKHGYHAEVDFKGQATHPVPKKQTKEITSGEVKGYKTDDLSIASYDIEESSS